MKQGNVSKQLGVQYDAQLLRRTREGNFIRYAIRDDTIIQLCNLVCCKVENDALAQVAAFKGVSNTSAKKNPKAVEPQLNRASGDYFGSALNQELTDHYAGVRMIFNNKRWSRH